MLDIGAKLRSLRPRFSLRTLVVIVTLFGVCLGIVTQRAVRQRRAVDVVRKYGGFIVYEHQLNDPRREHWTPHWLRQLVGEDYFVTARDLHLGTWGGPVSTPAAPIEQITDDDFAVIGRATSLRKLHFRLVPVTDQALQQLRGLTNLEVLMIEGAKLTDDGLRHLRDFRRLKELWLRDPAVGSPDDAGHAPFTDAVVDHLLPLTELRDLGLGTAQITDAGLARLTAALTKLESLCFSEALITDVGMASLVNLPRLESLFLSSEKITDEGLQYLANLKNLNRMSLVGTAVTDAGLAHLAGLKDMHTMNLSGTAVTDEGLKHLAQLPKFEILILSDTKVRGDGFVGFPALTLLRLNGTLVSDEQLPVIARLPKLEILTLERTGVTDAGIDALAPLRSQLSGLGLGWNNISDVGVAKLTTFSGLWDLGLEHTRVTDAGLEHLSALPLSFLHLKGTLVTETAAAKLRKPGINGVYTDASPDPYSQP